MTIMQTIAELTPTALLFIVLWTVAFMALTGVRNDLR